ncbi:MAG: hypothetical protein ACRDSJ_18370, partial [Rubrobacteraceae bacterium]
MTPSFCYATFAEAATRSISNDYAAIIPQATVQIWPDVSGMYLTSGSINNFPVEFLVDTGATLV